MGHMKLLEFRHREAAEALVAHATEIARVVAHLAIDVAPGEAVPVPDDVAADILTRAREITAESDTVRLPHALIPGAEALADAAYLLRGALEQGSVRFASEAHPIQEALTKLAVGDGDVAEDLHVSEIVIDANTYQNLVDYVFRAVKLLRAPAEAAGADITVLQTVFPEDRE